MTSPTIRPADELRPSRRLLEHLPGIYRQRDAVIAAPPVSLAPEPPLAALAGVIGRALDALHDGIGSLWDDHHVERAHPSALPLLAELFGVTLLSVDVSAQRALVARIVGWRRRKGTLLTLEEVLTETSTWDAEVDEGFRSVLATLELAHLAPWRGRTALVWDPIAMADPLTRRPAGEDSFDDVRPRSDSRRVRSPALAQLPGEAIDDTLRRLGRVDSGHHAASPRVLDLRGWARPDAILVRTSRLVPVELEEVEPVMAAPTANAQRRGLIDPAGRDCPLVWLRPITRPDLSGGVTARHEPAADEAPLRLAANLLTPTALAEDPDAAERAGAFQLAVDGVAVVGPPRPRVGGGPLAAAPVGTAGVVRFAEAARPSPGDLWRVSVIATLATGAAPDPDDDEEEDRELVTAELGDAGPIATTVAPGAGEQAHGRTVDLVVERLAGRAHRRAAAGGWGALALDPRMGPPVSNAVWLGGGAEVVRVERHLASGTNRLVAFTVGAPTREIVSELPAPLDLADGIALVADGSTVLAVTDTGGALGAWSITDAAGAATVERLDADSPRTPEARESPSLCVHGGRLYIFGGDVSGTAAGDMWSMPIAGGAWRPHSLRRRQERIGAALVSTPAGLALLGGDPVSGQMTSSCRLWDVATSRTWRELPSLPFDDLRPGLLIARATPAGIEALVWADRTRPVLYTLAAGADAWAAGALETDGPNPPANGEALFFGDDVLVVGPPPLPSSDLVFTQGDAGVLAVLPRLELEPGASRRLRVAASGATFRRDAASPGEAAIPRPLDTRFGGLFGDALLAAPASDGRHAQPGRLSRVPWRLAQRSLGPWDALVATAVDDAGAVLLDPRLGRFVLPPGAPAGRITVSCKIGRGGSLGPGLVPPGRAVPAAWLEPFDPDDPDLAVPGPPDLAGDGLLAAERDPHAYVAPHRAGQVARGPEGGDVAVVADLEAAHRLCPAGELGRVAVLGSARVPFGRVTAGAEAGLSIVAADPGSTPIIDRDDERDLSLLVQTRSDAAPAISLAGLWLTGALELAIERGQVDVRWCQIAGPGRRSVSIPGGGHQDLAARRSIPTAEIVVRLYGCQIGAIELPPWARLIAAGCTFDAGARDAVAIHAAGAAVRLRHCTVNGQTVAGALEASSCAFAGAVRVDRDDLGFVRHSLIARDSRAPRQYQSLVHTVSMISIDPTSPGYMVLAENNGPAALAAGEGAALPGAFGERGDHMRELETRTGEFLPIGMDPVHVDRSTFDLYRLGRR